ncbi:CHAP domain-containing protein [Streptomyces scabiei]|uniref:CHAP domain-containing protein n=1 Tax=Streptomyces scabiei TaxID=1930 RepID=UPI0036891063
MGQTDTLIAIEKTEVGYREGFSNGHYDNRQKFSPAVPGLEWSQNQAWCQTFQSWAFQQAGVKSLAPVTASCTAAVNWYKRRGRFSYYPAIGAMVFFGPSGGSHVGLVHKYDADYTYTIEGNTNANGSAEGNGVYLKKRARRDAFLYGYGLPQFDEGVVTADPGLRNKPGFTYMATAVSRESDGLFAAEAEAALPWVSAHQITWAATHPTGEDQIAGNGHGATADDVALVQDALEKVMGVAPDDPHSVFEAETQELFERFRAEKLGRSGANGHGVPEAGELAELGRRSDLFNVRAGSSPAAEQPFVSLNQVVWASTHSAEEERAQPGGEAGPKADVALVQDGLEKVMHTDASDERGIFETGTQALYDEFRRTVLHFSGGDAVGTPGMQSLTELGERAGLFRVRDGFPAGGPTGGGGIEELGQIDPKQVTFHRFTGEGTPEEWIEQAARAAGVQPSRHWVKGFMTAIPRESSGNPNACNLWDSNARTPAGFSKVKDYGDGYRGTGGIVRLNGALTHFQCSRGIVQCIPQTFAQRHAPGTSVNIYDPVACIAAAMRYVRKRYGVTADGSNLAKRVAQFDPNRPGGGY